MVAECRVLSLDHRNKSKIDDNMGSLSRKCKNSACGLIVVCVETKNGHLIARISTNTIDKRRVSET